MKLKILVLAVVTAISIVIFFDIQNQKSITAKITPTPTPYVFSENKLWDLIQDWKLENSGYTYSKEEKICKIADLRLGEIMSSFSHDGFYNHTEELYSYGYDLIGENLAKNFTTEHDFFYSWLRSPSHKENLEEDFKYSCLKCHNTYCVQIFANIN